MAVPLMQTAAEIRWYTQDSVHFPLLHSPVRLIHIHKVCGLEIFRAVHKIYNPLSFRGRVFQDHPDGGMLDVQADTVADDEDQHDGQYDAQGQAGAIPHNLPEFLYGQRPDPAQ